MRNVNWNKLAFYLIGVNEFDSCVVSNNKMTTHGKSDTT